jgi:hypothetical protein
MPTFGVFRKAKGTRPVYPDINPDAFSFLTVTNAVRTTEYSWTQTPVGYVAAAPISVIGGQISINGGGRITSGIINPGDSFTLYATSSSAYSTTITPIVIIGSTAGVASITTGVDPITPPVFETMNPLDKGTDINLTGGNLIVAASSPTDGNLIRSAHSVAINTGKYQLEVVLTGSSFSGIRLGLVNAIPVTKNYTSYLGANGNSFGIDLAAAIIDRGGYPNTGYLSFTPKTGDTLTFVLDTTYTPGGTPVLPTVSIARNGGAFNDVIPLTFSGGANDPAMLLWYNGTPMFVAASFSSATDTTLSFNFGASSFLRAVPNGVNLWPPNVGGGTPDTAPDYFNFTTLLNQTRNVDVTSNTITLTGVDIPVPLSISGGLYSKNGGAFTSTNSTISSGDTLQLKAHTPTGYSQNVVVSVTVSTLTKNFLAQTLVDPAAPAIPSIGPGASWNGSPGSGYQGALPTTNAFPGWTMRNYSDRPRPAVAMTNPYGIRFSTDLTIGVDAECVGGIARINAYAEGSVIPITTKVLKADTDVNGNARRREGYYCKLDVAAFLAKNTTGTVRVWFEAVPVDTTNFDSRFIGPFDFYPRSTAYSSTYNIGAGQPYATLKAAITAARAGGAGGTFEEAACFVFKTSGNYELEDETSLANHLCTKGFWTIMADPAVTVTLLKSTIDFTNPTHWQWSPQIEGIEFRGNNITYDMKYCSGITGTYRYVQTPGGYPNWFNGAHLINSLTQNTWYWNGDIRPQFQISPSFFDDTKLEYLSNGLADSEYVIGTTVLDCNFAGPTGTPYLAYNYYNGFNPNFFFYAHDNLRISYTGAGSAHIASAGSYGVGYTDNPLACNTLTLTVNGATVLTMPCGTKPQDTYRRWSAMAAAINGLAGWHATLGSDLNDPSNDSNTAWLIINNAVTSTPLSIGYYRDFHTDFLHFNEPTMYENVICRGQRVVGDVYSTQAADTLTMFRFADGGVFRSMDTFLLDNAIHKGGQISVGGSFDCSHLVCAGNSFGWRSPEPSGTNFHNYCFFQDNAMSFYWASNSGPTGIGYVDNFFVTNFSIASSLPVGALHHGNYVIGDTTNPTGPSATSVYDSQTPTAALFTNIDSGDFRPASGSALLSDLKVRRGKWDCMGYPRNTSGDVAGAFSKDTPAPFVQAYLPGGVFSGH